MDVPFKTYGLCMKTEYHNAGSNGNSGSSKKHRAALTLSLLILHVTMDEPGPQEAPVLLMMPSKKVRRSACVWGGGQWGLHAAHAAEAAVGVSSVQLQRR